jgi:hypothetical protein
MNEFTGKNEQAFLDACETIRVEPNAMVNTQKERFLDQSIQGRHRIQHPVLIQEDKEHMAINVKPAAWAGFSRGEKKSGSILFTSPS